MNAWNDLKILNSLFRSLKPKSAQKEMTLSGEPEHTLRHPLSVTQQVERFRLELIEKKKHESEES